MAKFSERDIGCSNRRCMVDSLSTTTTTLSWGSFARWPFEFRDLTGRTCSYDPESTSMHEPLLGQMACRSQWPCPLPGLTLHAKERSVHIRSIGFLGGH